MKKRNFILDFALKSKYNFLACVVALLVLIFSVSSITYSWIEGATSLQIKTGTATVYSGSNMAVNVLAQPTGTDATLSLANYIDPAKCSLAPAKGEIDANKNIVVKFLKDDAADTTSDDSFRNADTNDISNNYIFFETKVKPNDDISNYKFTLGDIEIPSIKVAISVLDSNRNPLSYQVSTAEQVNDGQIACGGLNGNTEYILQYRIWNDVTEDSYSADNLGKDANIKFTMAPQANFVTLYLRDYTNSGTKLKLLSDKTVKVVAGGKEAGGKKTDNSVYDQYEFEKVPQDSLNDVQFVAYNTDGTEFARWDLSGNAVAENSIYKVYGSASSAKTYGTFGELKKVSLVDKSAENLLNADKEVTMTNDAESYAMYYGTSSTDFSTYVPKTATNFKFNNSTYYAEEDSASTSTTPYYYILGESQKTTDGKKKCVGFWSDSAYSAFNNITIKDRSTGRLVEANATTLYASYPDSTLTTVTDKLYKAYYDSTKKEWKLTATNSSFTNNEDGMVWTFKAYASSTATTETYSWHIDGRKAQDSATYTFKSAVTGTNASDGTWGLYEVSQINPYILYEDDQKLVSFYGGVPSGWSVNNNTLYLALNGTASANNFVYSSKLVTVANSNPKVDGTEYKASKFIDVGPYQYWLKHNPSSWAGKQIPEVAKGGAFYTINDDGSSTISKVTGATKLNGSDSSSTSVLSLFNGPVSFSTETSSATSMYGETLYIEYFICPTSDENTANYYCINPSIVDSSGTVGTYCTTVDSSKTTASSFDFATRQDLVDFISANGDDYTIKTVLTDGTVYYVADSDYVTFLGEPAKVSVKLESVDNVTATASYEGSAGTSTINEGNTVENISEGTVLTLSATPASGYEFVNFEIYKEDGTTLVTTVENDKTYTVPGFNIVIKPVVKAQATRTIYLYDVAGSFSSTSKPKIWFWYADSSNSDGSTISLSSNHFTWDGRPKMSLVDGYTNVWEYTLPTDCSDSHDCSTANWFIFGTSGNLYCSDTSKNMYVNGTTDGYSSKGWYTFPPSTTDPTVTITNPSNATISAMYGSGTTITSSGTVPSGTQLTITVTPDSGYTVESITINGTAVASSDITTEGTKAICTYTVTGDTTITATVKASSTSDTTTIYFKNTAGWSNVKIYFYGSSTACTWPGVEMNSLGNNLYSYDIPNDSTGVVFVGTLDSVQKQTNSSSENRNGKNYFTCDATAGSDGKYGGTWSDYSGGSGSSTKTINVYVISYIYNSANVGNYNVRCVGGSNDGNDVTCTDKNTTKTYDVGYWSSAQTFHYLTAEIPADTTEFKFHIGDTWYGDNGKVADSNTVYIFKYSGDKATYTQE